MVNQFENRSRSVSGPDTRFVSRREILAALPVLGLTRLLSAQSPGPPIAVERLHSFGLRVSDVGRSVDFYQGLFGMPVQARQGSTVCLRIGAGPQYLALAPAAPSERPAITHIGFSARNFDPDRLTAALDAEGFDVVDPPGSDSGGAQPMQAWTRMRGDTPEVYFTDPSGLLIQLQDPGDCGGSGAGGGTCPPPEAAPSAGRLAVEDLSHFTIFVSDGQRANQFYQDLFRLFVQATQGPGAPLLGVGDRIQFIMFAGGGGRGRGGAAPANIHHVCLNMDGFQTDAVLAALTDYGIRPRGDGQATGPLMHYISMRMANRGGAPEGTPELYFTDPDGLLLQLQDSTYCGGGGVLGNVCG